MSVQHPVRDEEIVAYLLEYFYENLSSPSCRELCLRFGWKSPNAVTERIRSLRRKGLVRAGAEMQSRTFIPSFVPCPHCQKNLAISG